MSTGLWEKPIHTIDIIFHYFEKIQESQTFKHNKKKGAQAKDMLAVMLYDANNNQNGLYLSQFVFDLNQVSKRGSQKHGLSFYD